MKIAINGLGRIGRPVFRRILENHPDLEVVAINDLTDPRTLAYLLQYDSVYGRYEKKVSAVSKITRIADIDSPGKLIVDNQEYLILAEKDPSRLPWGELKIDVVLECTGFFTLYEGARKHLEAGADKVIISAPTKSPEIKTFVLGGNEKQYKSKRDKIISMASCTTNALVPIAKLIHRYLKIERALMTTIHSYTSTQRLVDGPAKDWRRARAAGLNLVLTTTGAAIAATKVLPDLENKIDGLAVRIPTPTVSLIDLTASVAKATSVDEVNEFFLKASQNELKGILDVSQEPLVSTDYRGNPHSSIVDLLSTRVENKRLVKVLAWYDNEWGYACRLADMVEFIGQK